MLLDIFQNQEENACFRGFFYKTADLRSLKTLKKNKVLTSFSLLRFVVHDRKLIQEMCFLLLVYYMGLCTGRSKKEATVRFFHRVL